MKELPGIIDFPLQAIPEEKELDVDMEDFLPHVREKCDIHDDSFVCEQFGFYDFYIVVSKGYYYLIGKDDSNIGLYYSTSLDVFKPIIKQIISHKLIPSESYHITILK